MNTGTLLGAFVLLLAGGAFLFGRKLTRRSESKLPVNINFDHEKGNESKHRY
ncbi:MAG: hypothetical protein ACNI27_05190 [Desulfovibrio sp.]